MSEDLKIKLFDFLICGILISYFEKYIYELNHRKS